jgi:hypothetical protein
MSGGGGTSPLSLLSSVRQQRRKKMRGVRVRLEIAGMALANFLIAAGAFLVLAGFIAAALHTNVLHSRADI